MSTAAPGLWRPRWRADATGPVARFAGEWASGVVWHGQQALADTVRAMPNGAQIDLVPVDANGAECPDCTIEQVEERALCEPEPTVITTVIPCHRHAAPGGAPTP